MGNLITTALLGIILSPIVQTYVPEKQVNLSEHPESVLCNCVAYTRLFRPDIPSMDARDFSISTSTPTKGSVAKMRYPSGAWHLAYVAEVSEEKVLLWHANVTPCKETKEWMDARNPRILGFF